MSKYIGKHVKQTNQTIWGIWIRVSGQVPTYAARDLHMHAHDMHVWDLFKNPNLEARKQSMNKKPNSNNQTCSEYKKEL